CLKALVQTPAQLMFAQAQVSCREQSRDFLACLKTRDFSSEAWLPLMQIACLPVVTIRASGALIDCLFSELAWMRRKSSVGRAAALAFNFCSSTVRTQIDKLAVCKATILCLARNHCSVRSSTSFGGDRSCS